jgi:hypothetical protein
MSNIFSKLLEESDNQRKQIQNHEFAALPMQNSDFRDSDFPSSLPLAPEASTAVFPPSETPSSSSVSAILESEQASLQANKQTYFQK